MAESVQLNAAASRADRLARLLHSFLSGLRPVNNSRDTQQLVQAICSVEDRATCAEKIGCSKSGLEVLRKSLRCDISITFINGCLTDLLSYLGAPEIKRFSNGEYLRRILEQIVSPPALWNSMVEAHRSSSLSPSATLTFAWLLLELLTWPGRCPTDVGGIAHDVTGTKSFMDSDVRELRGIGYRIQHILQAKACGKKNLDSGPGGRHDNDFTDFRQVAIYPTEDELTSRERPYYQPAQALAEVDPARRVAHHLDNQFRLMREDFLAELRDDIEVASGSKKGFARRPRTHLRELRLAGIYCGTPKFRMPFSLALQTGRGLDQLPSPATRQAYLKHNPNFLKHNSFGYFVDQGRVIAFGTLIRVQDLLLQDPPLVNIRTPGAGALEKVLLSLSLSQSVEFVLIDTAVFAYEPVLRCLQEKSELPLSAQLLADPNTEIDLSTTFEDFDDYKLSEVTSKIGRPPHKDLQNTLSLNRPAVLDGSQTQSLLSGLRQCVSLIQGPPGTGKSLIGALLAKALFDNTSENILVICYTNHALDQFLEDLLDIGIPGDAMVRLGSKFTPRTKPLTLRDQAFAKARSQPNWDAIKRLNDEVGRHDDSLQSTAASLAQTGTKDEVLLEHLEFSEDDYNYFEAFQVPTEEDGFSKVGKRNKSVDRCYLLQRWTQGLDAGVFANQISPRHIEIWELDKASRHNKLCQWKMAIISEVVSQISAQASVYDASQRTLQESLNQRDTEIIQKKRIIACTTTAAAMYTGQLQSAAPGIILVEEAGEILESHILTAMTPSTKQLILIGDHQQLRPKINNYNLTAEKGDGYDLNRSLFERLVLSGFPHTTLKEQHRMCPEISSLVRHLTYPELTDAPSTTEREPLRGLRKRVVFVKHGKQELNSEAADRRDPNVTSSKQNVYEAELVKKVVRYMAQQGYGTAEQVILTPYLGQLGLLRRELAKDNDPVLNDMDSFDLIRAGLMSEASASQIKRPIRLSTIDNYQGEESDVVIVSLTRSNANGDIGFMISPERLNVLLSRARKALIIIGNPATFVASKKGGELWSKLFDQLAETDSILEGLPVRCEQHPDRQMILESPADFDRYCPDGGCSAPCGSILACGLHVCSQKCHRKTDHSGVKCTYPVREECPQGHVLSRACSDGHPTSCHICDAEAAAKAAQQLRDLELSRQREARQRTYAAQLAAIQAEIDALSQVAKDQREQEQQKATMEQRLKDLETAKARAAQQTAAAQHQAKHRSATSTSKVPNINPTVSNGPSVGAAQDWHDQKNLEGAINPAMDELMAMIGLEDVKEQFLDIKAKIDLLVRQGLSIEKERFSAALLGNPGTGKTTVARLFAKFLCSVGALPGDTFVETTGAKLASEGTKGCQKALNELLNNGGGAFFIDEAYQLASGASQGGGAVLDFLLPEVENLTGKVVFILAGYNKQMEKFFQHNPGLPSRFPKRFQFADYEDHELLKIMNHNLDKRYDGRIMLEDGPHGLYARIVARRIGRGRGTEGFGNAREVENVVSRIGTRQARRLRKERRNNKKGGPMPNDMLLIKEDIIGPEPSTALNGNKTWAKLQSLIGLQSVKSSLQALLDSIQYNYQRELAEEPLVEFSLNKVFLGNPGTGKTSVAKIYGQLLADIGMLSSGEVVVKKPADFVGQVIGASEANTKGILDAAIGKVLVIDEAYGLYETAGTNTGADPYRKAIIDTIVAEVQNIPGDDRCVLLLGYHEQMEEMMQNTNPGLARRFPLNSAFVFEDFDEPEMASIFDLKVKATGFKVSQCAKQVALEVLGRARNRPHFGNAGEVDILLNDSQLRQQQRIAKDKAAPQSTLEAQDFDPDFDRSDRAITNITMLFKNTIGCADVIKQLQDYQQIAINMKKLEQDPRTQIPFNFLFRGPPGTGKTTTAQRMGKVYYDMGFLSDAKVVSCSASDLIGQFIGHTGPKTRKLLESALGKVLFIDEAYRLASTEGSSAGHFAQEALDELVDCMTKERFHNRLIIILAGYDADINRLMSKNPGLTSRFPETMTFAPLCPENCLDLLTTSLSRKKGLDASVIVGATPDLRTQVMQRFATLSTLAGFANARDCLTLAKTIFNDILKHPKAAMTLTQVQILTAMDDMILERSLREADAATVPGASNKLATPRGLSSLQSQQPAQSSAMSSKTNVVRDTDQNRVAHNEQSKQEADRDCSDDDHDSNGQTLNSDDRDAGVSDEIWQQLQLDRIQAEQEAKDLIVQEQKSREWHRDCADAKLTKELEELKRKREEQMREAQVKEMLKKTGRCPVGYEWIKQSGGYRCAGGSHWMSDGQVGELSQ